VLERFLAKLDRRYGRYALGNLTYLLVGLQVVGFAILLLRPELAGKMLLDRDAVFRGEWWRLFTFMLYPLATSPIWFVFGAYWLYIMGTALESQWGSLRYELYWIVGIVFTLAAVFLGGQTATITSLIMSLFLAFATLWPDYKILVFFFIPIPVKWLALLDGVAILAAVGFADGWERLVPLAAVGNYLLFFGPTLYDKLRRFAREGGRARARNRMRTAVKDGFNRHGRKCAICGADGDDPKVDLRVCSCEKCGGTNRDLCLEHARNH
jgi:membrane associated rhomboid family serine protease